MFEKREESSNDNILDDDEILMFKAGISEEYTLILNHLDMDLIEISFDQADVSKDEGKINKHLNHF
jgi:hypothetical protein